MYITSGKIRSCSSIFSLTNSVNACADLHVKYRRLTSKLSLPPLIFCISLSINILAMVKEKVAPTAGPSHLKLEAERAVRSRLFRWKSECHNRCLLSRQPAYGDTGSQDTCTNEYWGGVLVASPSPQATWMKS